MKAKITCIYIVCAWTCLIGCSLFSNSERFMDPVLYPKWIITAIVAMIFAIFSLPLFLLSDTISWKYLYKQISISTIILVFTEALIAVFCFFTTNNTYQQYVAGSYNNIAGLASCLAISFPIGFSCLHEYNIYEKIVFYISKLLSIVVIVVYGSRLGCICILVIATLELCKYRHKNYLALIIGCASFVLSACFIKTHSTIGRWFVIERTLELIMKRPLFGWGTGGFTKEYMNMQASFFSANPGSPLGQFADNIHHPLNEFLLIATNYGIPVVILFVTCCVIIYLYYISHKTVYGKEGGCIILSILLFAFFSYPFSYPYTWLLFVLSLLLVFSRTVWRLYKRVGMSVTMLSIVIICIIAFIPLKRELDFQLSWKNASQLYQNKTFEDIKNMYDSLYQEGKGNYCFLYDYACKAYNEEYYSLSLELSKETEKMIADYDLKMLIGDCYQSLQKTNEALEAYRKAYNMCPSKYMPLYESYKIYSSRNDTINCIKLYEHVINKKEKNHSRIIEVIINEIKHDFLRFNLHNYQF